MGLTLKLTLIQRVTAYSIAVALVAVAALAVVGFSYVELKDNATHAQSIALIDKATVDVARGVGELVLTEGSKSARELVKRSTKSLSDNLGLLDSADPKVSEAASAWTSTQADLSKMMALKGVGPTDDDTLILFGSLQTKTDALMTLLEGMRNDSDFLSQKTLKRSFTSLGIALTLVVLLVVASGLLTRSTLARRVGGDPAQVVAVFKEVSSGNLAGVLHVSANDQDSILAETLKMRDALRTIVMDVRGRAETISDVSAQSVLATSVVVEQSQAVSSELAESARAVQAASQSSSQTYGHAKSAQQAVQQASRSAEEGGAVVAKVVENMRNIGASSKKISEIIAVINGIAFQTNILALNAAVEAARAGEQGRGFAVVASEVRALAQRSASAAHEIKSLIDASVGAVRDGQEHVENAGRTMEGIVAGVTEVNALIEGIFQSVSNQDQTLKGLAMSVQNVESLNQIQLDSVDSVSDVAGKLQGQSIKLMELVEHFRA